MYRQTAIFALSALFATACIVALPCAATADEVDEYYEDDYDDDYDAEFEEDPETAEEAAEAEEPTEDLPDPLRYARTGAYAHFGIAQLFENLPNELNAKNDAGVDFRIGARFRRYFAAELDYQAIPNWELTFPSGIEEITIHSVTVNAKAFLYTGRIQPFVQAGMGVAISQAPGSDLDSSFEGRFGGGLAFYATENIVLSLTAVYTMALDDLEMTVGSGQGVPAKIEDLQYLSLIWAFGYHF